jgi:hypothetical protein
MAVYAAYTGTGADCQVERESEGCTRYLLQPDLPEPQRGSSRLSADNELAELDRSECEGSL